jgi:hypothetical protein
METGENITLAMVPDFELNAEDSIRAKAWAAFDAKQLLGITLTEVYQMTGLTHEQLMPYEKEWERMHNLVNA